MSTAIASLFTPGINKHTNLRSKRIPSVYTQVFKVEPMTGRVLMRQSWELYQPPQITLPLNPVHMGEVKESFSSAYTPIKRTLGDLVAEEDWDDDEYGVLRRVIPARAGAMADIFAEKKEWDCANYLAVTGFTTASPAPHSPDGQPLFSTAHPLSKSNASTWANRPTTAVDLSHTAYYAAYGSMVQNYEANGYSLRMDKPSKLIYNPKQRPMAVQIAQGDWERTSSYQNDMNIAKRDSLQLVEWAHFRKTGATSAANAWNAWVLLGDDAELIFVDRQGFRAKTDYDINHGAYIWVASVRYDIGHDSAYSTYGCPGA